MNNDVGQSAAKCAVAGEPRGHGHGFQKKVENENTSVFQVSWVLIH